MTVFISCGAWDSSEPALVDSCLKTLGKRRDAAFVSRKEVWNDCSGNVGGILLLCLAPAWCDLGPGQDKINKKTIQNVIFDNPDWIEYGHSPERKCFICASCSDINNYDKIRKRYTQSCGKPILWRSKEAFEPWITFSCCAVVFRGLFMFSCG